MLVISLSQLQLSSVFEPFLPRRRQAARNQSSPSRSNLRALSVSARASSCPMSDSDF